MGIAPIVEIRERTASIRGDIRNSVIDFSGMTISLVAVITARRRGGKPVVGFGFHSNGRYAQGGILRERLIPRLLAAAPELTADERGLLDPAKAAAIYLANEKPGGHGDRAAAAGALDMALWDAAAKLARVPLWQLIAERFNGGKRDERVMVYPGGGYYYPGKDLRALKDEMRGYLDLGYRAVKMKIGGASAAEDLRRIDAVVSVIGDPARVAVDANGRFSPEDAARRIRQLDKLGLLWLEEPLDPLDFDGCAALAERCQTPLASGENLFSFQDARNLLRHGGLRPGRDFLQMDPSLSYGLPEYLRMVREFENAGWSRRRFIPHGGHQFNLNIAAGLKLGGCESYPGVFQPYGGFADDIPIEDGTVRLSDAPGVGVEARPRMFSEMRRLLEIEIP
jgi:L-alanine-DL-glutamate epimerase-like enolase superfamily enzyme